MKPLEAKINPEDVPARLKSSRILATVVRGILWIDDKSQRYRVDPFSRVLLEVPANEGPLSDLKALFDSEFAESKGPLSTRSIAFATPGRRYLRMRHLCTTHGEKQFMIEDMTELVLSDLELQENDNALRKLFENATHGIYRATLSGQHVFANPALTAMMGFEKQEDWLAKSKSGIRELYVNPERYDEFNTALQKNGRVSDFVCEMFKSNGEKFWVSATAWMVRDKDEVATHIDGTFTDVTERMRHYESVKHAAETDELTGLCNRSKVYSEIEQRTKMMSGNNGFTVLLFDLDRFKDINDVYGHATGDAVLVEISQRLRDIVGDFGVVARLGGDEFAAVIEDAALQISVEELGNRFLTRLREPIPFNGAEHAMSASIGVARFPDDATERAELLRKADIALYNVKSHGRNSICRFKPEFEHRRQRAHFLAQELRDAGRRGELELYYQPIVAADTSAIMGFEALMRWNHPDRGMISPAEFIPIAEDAGYMQEFGGWAIQEACSHIVTLPKHLYVSVNVSAVQFNASDFPLVVEKALEITGLHPSRLELEVTEGVVIRNEERTAEILNRLKKIGVRVALDDFGTGYSSFSYLQKFHFDKVKIDRSFVRDLADNKTNAALVRAVLSIGRDLGLEVVAEGIENLAQRDQLVLEGCPFFQGYLFGRPAPFSDVASNVALQNLPQRHPALEQVEVRKLFA